MGRVNSLLKTCVTVMVSFQLITGELCKYDRDPCICKTNAFELNLKPLMDGRQGTDFSIQDAKREYTYYVQPCNKPMTSQKSACSQKSPPVVSCQLYQNEVSAYGLASLNEYDATGSPDEGIYFLTNSYSDIDFTKRILNLTIKCSDQEATFTLDSVSGSSPYTYSFTILTKHVCKGGGSRGLSVGSVMVIIFFVLLVVYLVGGLTFLKFVKKAEGREVIPNYTFWTAIPLLIKDGFLFTFGCCRGNRVYGKI